MKNNYLTGIIFKLINCLIFPVMTLLMVKTVGNLPTMQVLFMQVLLGAIISLIYLIITKKAISFTMKRRDFLLYLGRAVTNLIAMYLWLFAIKNLGMNEATAITYTGPLWVCLMAGIFLKEKFGKIIFALLAINSIGMLIILHPKLANIHWYGAAAALGAILLWSLYEVMCKIQTTSQHYMLQSFYFMALSAIIIAPFALNSWQSLTSYELNMLWLIALLSVTNITMIFIAYSLAPLTLLSPFSYSRLVFTAFLTNWLFQISPTKELFIGSGVIMTANLYFIYRVRSKS